MKRKIEKTFTYKVKENMDYVFHGIGNHMYTTGQEFIATEAQVKGQEYKLNLVKKKKESKKKKAWSKK